MRIRAAGGPKASGRVRVLGVVALLLAATCQRPAAPTAPEAPHAPPPPPVPAYDAGPRDAAGDASDAAAAPTGAPAKTGPRKAAASSDGERGGSRGVKVEGKLPRPAAEKVVRAGTARLRACYEQERTRNPTLHGRVTFRLSVDDRGKVPLGEVVTSTLGGGDPEMCMIQAARDFRFAPGGGDSTVSFQVTFGH